MGIIILTYVSLRSRMAKGRKTDRKLLELKRTGTLNPYPTAVTDTLFRENPFFDSKDLLQVRYEMLRRHRVEDSSIVDVATAFGVSRPTFYQAQTAFDRVGLAGPTPCPLLPHIIIGHQHHRKSNQFRFFDEFRQKM